MGCNDVVTVHQVAAEECSCCPNKDFISSPTDIAEKLLLQNEKLDEVQVDGSGAFQRWYESRKLIAFSFTLHPPTLSLDNQSLIGMCLGNETHASSGIDDLPEFCPVYSGSSCLKSECQKYIYKTQTGSVAEHTAAKLIEVQECCLRQCHKSHQVVTLKDLNKANGKNQVSGTAFKEIDKPLYKWCVSPPVGVKRRKAKDLMLEKLRETNLQQVKSQYSLNSHQRGKWVLTEKTKVCNGKGPVIEVLWKRVCSLITEGFLPHCNAKFQNIVREIWIYCDFVHSLKVRSILENGLGNIGTIVFRVHPTGVVMEL